MDRPRHARDWSRAASDRLRQGRNRAAFTKCCTPMLYPGALLFCNYGAGNGTRTRNIQLGKQRFGPSASPLSNDFRAFCNVAPHFRNVFLLRSRAALELALECCGPGQSASGLARHQHDWPETAGAVRHRARPCGHRSWCIPIQYLRYAHQIILPRRRMK